MDITHDNVCSSMLSCFYSHLLSTGRPISSFVLKVCDFCDCIMPIISPDANSAKVLIILPYL